MMKEEARLDLCIHHVAEQSLLSSYQRSPHHITHSLSPTKISTTRALTINQSNSLLETQRERDHSGIRTQDKLLFHFNIFFEFLWMETMFSIGDDQADEERVWNNWIGIESLTVRSAQP